MKLNILFRPFIKMKGVGTLEDHKINSNNHYENKLKTVLEVQDNGPDDAKFILKMDGMTCGKCPAWIEKTLDKRDGEKKSRAFYIKRETRGIIDDSAVTIEDMRMATARAGDEPGD